MWRQERKENLERDRCLSNETGRCDCFGRVDPRVVIAAAHRIRSADSRVQQQQEVETNHVNGWPAGRAVSATLYKTATQPSNKKQKKKKKEIAIFNQQIEI